MTSSTTIRFANAKRGRSNCVLIPVRVSSRLTAGCGGKGIRTPGLLIANETLYQLSYTPAEHCHLSIRNTGRQVWAAAVPPPPSERGACRVGDDVAPVGGGMGEKMRRQHLEEDGPEDQHGEDFSPRRRSVVAAQAGAPFQPEEHRDGAGHEQKIIEPPGKKTRCDERLDQPAVENINRPAGQEETVPQVTEFPQSRATMTKPRPVARSPLAARTIMAGSYLVQP
jgi:hypothetical protein